MLSNKEKPIIKRKHCLIILLGFGLTIAGAKAFAQTPPPPPPPPDEVLKSINPFKKNKKAKDTVKKVDTSKTNKAKPAGPPPPPNPLNLFKKKKKDTVKTSPPPQKS
jgi:hypothetical protein